jgi:hypothetical protein
MTENISDRKAATRRYGIFGDDSCKAKAFTGCMLLWATVTGLTLGLSSWWFLDAPAAFMAGFLAIFMPGAFPISWLLYCSSQDDFYRIVVNRSLSFVALTLAVLFCLAAFTVVLHETPTTFEMETILDPENEHVATHLVPEVDVEPLPYPQSPVFTPRTRTAIWAESSQYDGFRRRFAMNLTCC